MCGCGWKTQREREREREEECFKQCIEELLLEVLYVLNVFYTHILLSLYSYSVTSSDNLSAQIFHTFFPFQSGADDADHAGGVCVCEGEAQGCPTSGLSAGDWKGEMERSFFLRP